MFGENLSSVKNFFLLLGTNEKYFFSSSIFYLKWKLFNWSVWNLAFAFFRRMYMPNFSLIGLVVVQLFGMSIKWSITIKCNMLDLLINFDQWRSINYFRGIKNFNKPWKIIKKLRKIGNARLSSKSQTNWSEDLFIAFHFPESYNCNIMIDWLIMYDRSFFSRSILVDRTFFWSIFFF